MKYIIVTVIFLLLGLAFYAGAQATEKHECITWQNYAQEGYVDYYVTDWQIAQCETHNIRLTD